MRLTANNVFHKKSTRNTLSITQMNTLHNLGLCNVNERSGHTEVAFGVEELLQILPMAIQKGNGLAEDVLYSLKVYKTAFDVIGVGYINHNGKELCYIGCDVIANSDNLMQSGNLVEVLYQVLLWVNREYPNELKEYKEALDHYIKSL